MLSPVSSGYLLNQNYEAASSIYPNSSAERRVMFRVMSLVVSLLAR